MTAIRSIDAGERRLPEVVTVLRTLIQAYAGSSKATATQLGAAANRANTVGKFESKRYWDSTNKRPLWASGPDPTDAWNDASGSAAITPS